MSSEDEGEGCEGYDSERSEEEVANSEDERFIASSDDESSGSDYEPDHHLKDAETFHKEAIAAVHAMRSRRRARRKTQEAVELVQREVEASLRRPVQRPTKRRRISTTGKHWTTKWWEKDKNKSKEKKAEYVTCAHASCHNRVHKGTLYCKIHGYNMRVRKKITVSKNNYAKKKRRLEDLKEEMCIWGRYSELQKRAFPAKTKASSCSKCGQKRVGLFYCADHSRLERLRKRLAGRTREAILRDLEVVRSVSRPTSGAAAAAADHPSERLSSSA